MNNCTHHFHYDTGNAADVISSLQMVKRTRKMKHLHLYLKEKVKLEPTDFETLDDLFNQNIETYFKGQANGVTIEIDENGDFKLSEIGRFMNKIQAFHNRLENNHKMSFNILLGEQFKFKSTSTNTSIGKIKMNKQIKETKENIKNLIIKQLDSYNFDFVDDIESLKNSGRTLSEKEKIDIIIYELEQKINTSDKDVLRGIAKSNIKSDNKMLEKITNLILLYRKDVISINNEIDRLISSGVKSSDFKEQCNFLRDTTKLFKYKLQSWYSDNEIKKIQEEYSLNDFKHVLRKIGYSKKGSRLVLDEDVQKYFMYFV